MACQNGQKKAVDVLLAANANVNLPRTGDKTSPLMMAVCLCFIIKLMLCMVCLVLSVTVGEVFVYNCL